MASTLSRLFKAAAVGAGIILLLTGTALSGPRDPIDISADSMELLKEEKRAIFIGKVRALKEGVSLNSDKLVADYVEIAQPDGSSQTEVRYLNATGHVLVVTKTQKITAQWATMDVKADTAVMGGNVVVVEGKTRIQGPKLFLNLTTGESKMEGGRVKGRFFPQD